jgi:GT2 family glycosyltransferase
MTGDECPAPSIAFVGSSSGNAFMNELLGAIAHEVRRLGVSAEFVLDTFPRDSSAYVVVPHEYFATAPETCRPSADALARTVALCVEQPGSPWFEIAARWAAAAGAAVDISRLGACELEWRGVEARHVRLGYSDYWDRWHGDDEAARETDVIHLGSDTWRRRNALAGYASTLWPRRTRILLPPVAVKRTERPDFLLGEAKWSLLRSSKILLNIHRDDLPFFEWVRVLEAIANGCVVVTEHSRGTEPLEPGVSIVSGEVGNLGLLAEALLEDEDRLSRLRRDAYDVVRQQLPMQPLAETLVGLAGALPKRPRALKIPVESVRTETSPPAPPVDGDAVAEKRRLLGAIDEARRAASDAARQRGEDPRAALEVARTPPYEDARPRVSVLIPVYNHATVVGEAIRSAAESSFPELEVVVLDDGSTDGSADAAWAALVRHPWLPGLLLRHVVNQGLGAARNHLVERCRGEYVFALDADNELYPTALERLVAALHVDEEAFFAYTILEEHEEDRPTSLRSYQPWETERLREGNYIDAMALMRREELLDLGGYTNELELYGWEDYDLWCRAAERGLRGVHIPEILCRYHRASMSMVSITAVDESEARGLLRARYPKTLGTR